MRKVLVLVLAASLAAPAGAAWAAVLPQDDAGSGGDAPNVPTPTFRIEPGRAYGGTIEGSLSDRYDWYAFDATAGEAIEGRMTSPFGCLRIHDATATELASTCGTVVELGRVAAVAPTTGTYYLEYSYLEPHVYRFSLGVGAEAPPPGPVDTELFPATGTVPPVAAATQSGEHAVIAVVDTGANLYHEFFRAPALTAHPSSWLPGFPASATTVGLSLGAASYADAVAADAATFAGLQRSAYDPVTDTFDEHLYTFPGTRVVGAVSFGEFVDDTDLEEKDRKPVRDENGHGTHSAGLVAGANLPDADGNVLLVVVEVGPGLFADGIRWAARQPWIDAISVSLGNVANVPLTTSPTGDRTGPEWATHEAYQSGKPVLVASGNGFSNAGVAPDHCSTYTSPYAGPAWVTRIGAAQPDDGNPTWWHCVPVDAIARTHVKAPVADQLAGVSSATGTSASTPNAAGHFAHLLLAGRRAGSGASRQAVLDHLLHAAQPVPTSAGAHDPSVYPLSLADQGYGLVDADALDAATARLLSGSGPLPRPETEEWFAADASIRASLWGPGSATAGSDPDPRHGLAQDDAGSGRDAPDWRVPGVPVEPGVRYSGTFTGAGADEHDWYTFDGTSGDVVEAQASAGGVCVEIVSPSGVAAMRTCSGGYALPAVANATLDATGTWYLHVEYPTPGPYTFAFGRNAPAPTVFP